MSTSSSERTTWTTARSVKHTSTAGSLPAGLWVDVYHLLRFHGIEADHLKVMTAVAQLVDDPGTVDHRTASADDVPTT